jgi:hypothetical protein
MRGRDQLTSRDLAPKRTVETVRDDVDRVKEVIS